LYQDAIRNFAESNNLCIFKVATAGDGTIASDPNIIAGKEQASYDFSSYIDILDNHQGKLKDNEVLKYSH